MPKITFSKESLEGKPPLPDGLYEIRLEGFEPEFAKSRNSVNLNPILKVVNHPTLNGQRQFDNLNTGAGWIIESFCHALGLDLTRKPDGSADIPGDFMGPEDDPEKWEYVGPLVGCVAKVFVKQTSYNGKTNSKVDQWMCAVPGCTTKHASGLAK